MKWNVPLKKKNKVYNNENNNNNKLQNLVNRLKIKIINIAQSRVIDQDSILLKQA